MKGQPFSRFQSFMPLVYGLIASQPGLGLQYAVSALGGYRSRGKGKDRSRMVQTNFMRGANRSKYVPHQGDRERNRRLSGGFAHAR